MSDEQVEVIQADVHAAAAWLADWDVFSPTQCRVDLARAFARHRIAATAQNDARVEVTQSQVLGFLGDAFRNIDLPALDKDDVRDIQKGLADFARLTLSADGSGR